ncbi:T9SS type A sorting domain-containing protein [Flavobacterium sp. 25HG05S-40]|uniref:T9SS type A sorting domain-containing protein n=1 Tax=Flavobacterium sp. 25HG05S-40 TaxID=3458682 RepID=UPI004044361F
MKNILLSLVISFSTFLNAQNYVPDPTFSTTGSLITNYNAIYGNGAPRSVHFENNKYIFGQNNLLSSFNYDGSVDYSFGTSGFSRIIIPNCACPVVIKNTKIINNAIFIFGKTLDYNSNQLKGFVAKMSLGGIPDETFGTNGVVTMNIGVLDYNDSYSDGITDIVYKNGNYFAIGNILYFDSSAIIRRNIFAVKLNNNGIIDLAFDASGLKKFTSVDGNMAENIFDYNGNLLIVGNVTNNNTSTEISATFLEINENGSLNAAFGNNGLKKIVYTEGCACAKILKECKLVGNYFYYTLTTGYFNGGYSRIQKIDISTLQNINTFASLNVTEIAPFNSYSLGKFIIDNNKIYILNCLTTNCQPDFNITRRNLDGTLDTTFNQTGFYSYTFPGPFVSTPNNDEPKVLFKHSDNRIFIAGYTSSPLNTSAQYNGFAMHRIKDETLSTTEVSNNHFTLSPNPVQNILNIKSQDGISIDTITIFDVLGKIVYSGNNIQDHINVENLKDGLYFVKIKSGYINSSFKIIKRN